MLNYSLSSMVNLITNFNKNKMNKIDARRIVFKMIESFIFKVNKTDLTGNSKLAAKQEQCTYLQGYQEALSDVYKKLK